MFRNPPLILVLVLGLAGSVVRGQTLEKATAVPSSVTPHPAHSDAPSAEDGTKANPADGTSPPLADPLKQQAVTDAPPTLATPAVQFIMQASMDGLTEMQMAELALEHSSDAKIRRFAGRVLADQRALNEQLETLASKQGTSVPDVVDSDHASGVQRLAALSGSAFDADYVAHLQRAAGQALALYSAASTLNDTAVSHFASVAVPTLRAHQSAARRLGSPTPSAAR